MAEYGYSELDVQYSPRMWVRRLHEKVVVQAHMDITGAESDRVAAVVPHCSHRYGSGPREELEEFGCGSLPDDAPIFVYIHGGYWQHLSKEVSYYPVQPLFDAGIRVVVVGYDLAPEANMKQIVEETKRAGSHITAMAEKLGSSGIWFSGYSAGGHLTGILLASEWMASLPAQQRRLIKGFLPISGIFDVKPIVQTYINGPLRMNDEEADKYSPMSMKLKIDYNVKVLTIFGQYDSPAFHKQSKRFVKKLQEMEIDADWYEVADMDHFSLVENLSQHDYVLTKRLINIIKLNRINEL